MSLKLGVNMHKICSIFSILYLFVFLSCVENKEFVKSKVYKVIPCPEIYFNCTSKPYHDYLELDGTFSVYNKDWLPKIFSSTKISLGGTTSFDVVDKKMSEIGAYSCFAYLAFFDSKNKLEYVIGLCFYSYVFTVIDGKDCIFQKGRIIPVSGESFKISDLRRNKKLFIKIVQKFYKINYFMLGKDSWISHCYPDIKPVNIRKP